MEEWVSSLSVGVEQIDVEHRQILRRLSQLVAAANEGRLEEVRGALRFLHAYLSDHFEDEQRWMEDAGYPGAREHARNHAALLVRIATAREVALGQPAGLAAFGADVARGVEEHMRLEDLKLARFFTARANLRLLAEAAPGHRAVLTPLPGALEVVRLERAPLGAPSWKVKPGGSD